MKKLRNYLRYPIQYLKYWWYMNPKTHRIRKRWYKFLFFWNNNPAYFHFHPIKIKELVILDNFVGVKCPKCGGEITQGWFHPTIDGKVSVSLSHKKDDSICKYGIIELKGVGDD